MLLASCNQVPVSVTAEPAPVDKAAVILENIMTRASVRSFTNEPVSRETLQTIVRAGFQAPSAMNKQDWEVRIVDSQSKLTAASDIMKNANPNATSRFPNKNAFGNAAAVLFIASEQSDQPGTAGQIDAGLLAENILLAAKALGLGAVIQASPIAMLSGSAEGQDFIKSLGFSDNYQPLFIIPIGYPDQEVSAGQRDTSKAKFVD